MVKVLLEPPSLLSILGETVIGCDEYRRIFTARSLKNGCCVESFFPRLALPEDLDGDEAFLGDDDFVFEPTLDVVAVMTAAVFTNWKNTSKESSFVFVSAAATLFLIVSSLESASPSEATWVPGESS
jgi:hypothetical protein